MGMFKRMNVLFDDIVSVVIIEQTQNYKKKTKAGLVFGNSVFNPDVVLMDGEAEPDGVTYTFSLTYRDGRKEIIKADSGTDLCDRLLQMAMDGNAPVSEQMPDKKPPRALELQKNQFPQGVYEIGKDIPPGTYDFHLV